MAVAEPIFREQLQPTPQTAVAALDPIIALLALIQLTGDRTLLDKYGPALEGTQNKTREAFVAITGTVPHEKADETIANEVRENRLLRGRRVAVDHATSASKRVRQVERQHSVAKPKRGKQCLRKCPQINYAFSPRVLETLQRTPLPSLVLQFRIEIVLDDPGAILMGPIQ